MDLATKFFNCLKIMDSDESTDSVVAEFRPYMLLSYNLDPYIIFGFSDRSFFSVKKGEHPTIFNIEKDSPEQIPEELLGVLTVAMKERLKSISPDIFGDL